MIRKMRGVRAADSTRSHSAKQRAIARKQQRTLKRKVSQS